MENLENFTKELFEVFDEKVRWYETEELPKMLEEYRKEKASIHCRGNGWRCIYVYR